VGLRAVLDAVVKRKIPGLAGNRTLIVDLQISVSQHPTHYTPLGTSDVFDIMLNKNVRLSDVMDSDIVKLRHLSNFFHILDHVRATDILIRVEGFTQWERCQSFASELISPSIQTNCGEEAHKTDRNSSFLYYRTLFLQGSPAP
jgi:hypothetical protein